jgi:Rad3-related DNA helicase
MSGTITESYIYDILELDAETTEVIQLPPVFPPEHKPVFFIGKQALNYQAMKDPETISTLKEQIKKIVTFHKDQKGLILVPSFYLGNQLSFGVKYTKVFEHKQGTNISELINDFKNYSGSAVFVSPSIFEGLSFDDDMSRFQILVKTPFDSLGDRRIKHIADNYPKIYREMALLKIVQGAGRAVRSPEDWAATYCLDKSTQRIFEDKSNIWKHHFKIMSK